MAASIEEITKEAIDLPRHQRLALVRLLLDLDQPGASEEIECTWDKKLHFVRRWRSGDLGLAIAHGHSRPEY